jgi:hypothetical protein
MYLDLAQSQERRTNTYGLLANSEVRRNVNNMAIASTSSPCNDDSRLLYWTYNGRADVPA